MFETQCYKLQSLKSQIKALEQKKSTLTDTAEIKAVVYYNNASHPLAYKSELDDKQDKLVSGTNIKTINSTSLLGSGDISVQPTLVSGTNIKTINNQSILGSGNIVISQGGASWGNISGTLSNQTDLQNALDAKYTKGDNLLIGREDMTGGIKIEDGKITLYGSYTGISSTMRMRKTEITATFGDIVLWTNPSPTASMGATTITLSEDVTHFAYIMIIFASSSYPDRTYDSKIMSAVVGASVYGSMPTDVNRRRLVTIATATTLTTGRTEKWASYGGSSSNSSSDDKFLVVKEVIGFKFHN